MYTTVPLLASPFTSQFPLGISRSLCGQGSHACGCRGRLSGGLQLVPPTGSRPPVQTNRSAYGKPVLCPSPALPLPCPGAWSSARAAGRGRDRSPGAGPLAPAGRRRGGAGTSAGHNFSACGSGRGWPAAKLPRSLAQIFFFFWLLLLFPPRCPRTFDIVLPGTEPPPPQPSRARGSGAGKRPEGFAPAGGGRPGAAVGGGARPPRPLAGENGGAGGWA